MCFNVMVDKIFWVLVLWLNLSRLSVVNVKLRGSRKVNWEHVLTEISPRTFCKAFVTCPSCWHPMVKCLQSLETPKSTQGCWGNTPILSPLCRQGQVVAPALRDEAKQTLWSSWQLQGLIYLDRLRSAAHFPCIQRAWARQHSPFTYTAQGAI